MLCLIQTFLLISISIFLVPGYGFAFAFNPDPKSEIYTDPDVKPCTHHELFKKGAHIDLFKTLLNIVPWYLRTPDPNKLFIHGSEPETLFLTQSLPVGHRCEHRVCRGGPANPQRGERELPLRECSILVPTKRYTTTSPMLFQLFCDSFLVLFCVYRFLCCTQSISPRYELFCISINGNEYKENFRLSLSFSCCIYVCCCVAY